MPFGNHKIESSHLKLMVEMGKKRGGDGKLFYMLVLNLNKGA
ncbi:MAG: hypothetical protein ACTSQI_15705 [Candidatus Helarchaeota archaeon]